MDKFAALKTFHVVAETGGFSKAAQRLGLSTSSVTRTVGALETALGTVLVTRSTRKIALTAAGKTYIDQTAKILLDLAHADESISDVGAHPLGTLRVAVPATYSRIRLAPLFPRYMEAYPDVVLEIDDSDRYIDLSAERIDMAIRIGTSTRDQNLVVKKLVDSPRYVVASPDYLSRAGHPNLPADLAEHLCLRFSYESGSRHARQTWTFSKEEDDTSVGVSGNMVVNNLDLLLAAALSGAGVALLPEWLVGPSLASGALVHLLPGWEALPPVGRAAIYAAYLPNRRYSSKVRTFIQFLEQHLSMPMPQIDGPRRDVAS